MLRAGMKLRMMSGWFSRPSWTRANLASEPNVSQDVSSKEDFWKQFLAEKDERLKEKDNVLKSLELKILDVETKWMRELSRHEGVIANRQTVELICRQNYPKDPPTIASSKFCWETLIQESVDKKGNKGVTLKPRGLELLKELEPEQNEFIKQSVASELKDLYHELSKPLHFADPVERGLHISGRLPLRAAIPLFVLQAQAKKNHPIVYCYTDEKGQTLKILQNGHVTQPQKQDSEE